MLFASGVPNRYNERTVLSPTVAGTSAGKPIDFVPVTALDLLPGIEWLIQDVLPAQGIAVLYGEPGHGKSFLAIDWALHVASGKTWAGKPVAQGPVVYVVAEGSRGMKDRMKAWRLTHPDADVSSAVVVLEPIMLHDVPARKRFIDGIATQLPKHPSLIILDTLAQNFVGGDENSAQDMGTWLYGARLLQEKFNAAVLIVHHAARGSGRERGSTALRGAADAMILMKRPSEKVNAYKMVCTKMKDGECFSDALFQIIEVEGTVSAVLTLAPNEGKEPIERKKRETKDHHESPALVGGGPLFLARLHELASTVSLKVGAETLVREFPDMWEDAEDAVHAAKARLSRARAKLRAEGKAVGGEFPLVTLEGFDGVPDAPIS